MACAMCDQISRWRGGDSSRLVHVFPNSVLLVGDHQYFRGYCLLVLKEHVADLHELDRELAGAFLSELMLATEAIARAFEPAKMNHASYGNQVPHLHWHIFPRYADDPDRAQVPWLRQDRFSERATSQEQAAEVIALLRPLVPS